MKRVRPLIKVHGGKFYLSKWIIEHFPEDYQKMLYLEPFCGGASVLFNKDSSEQEVINDLDKDVINLFKVVRDKPQCFIKKVSKIKYSEKNFLNALDSKDNDELGSAVNEFIVRRMSRGGLKKAFAWSDRERGGKPGDVNSWETIIKLLPTISERLKDVFILNRNALEIIRMFDEENTLCYCDPPYLPETREANDLYSHEMNIDGHIELSEILNRFKGKALISGYPSRLYNKLYKNWKCEKKSIANHSSQQKIKPVKLELLWRNF
jgi:DNA adenine methylase